MKKLFFEKIQNGELTIITDLKITIDFTLSIVKVSNKIYKIPSLGTIAQELILCGGLESWVKRKIMKNNEKFVNYFFI